ncbi:MAG: hypothetical protein AAFN38_21710 [Cyanobacteria bacterium J06560_5]
MGGRYSDIRRGGQLKIDLDNYINYLTQPRERNVGNGGDRSPQTAVYVTPFGKDLDTDELASVNAPQSGYAALNSFLVASNGADLTNAIGTKTPVEINGYRPAKVVWFRNATKVKTVVRSSVTNRQYLKYEGDRDTCPFGRAAATDDMMDVFLAIKADIKQANSTLEVNRISLTRERIAL